MSTAAPITFLKRTKRGLVWDLSRYKKNFKIKNKIPLNTMWIANCMDIVGDANIHSGRSFVLGWPMVNFVATFR